MKVLYKVKKERVQPYIFSEIMKLITLNVQIALYVIKVVSDSLYIPGYYKWSYGNRTEIFCPLMCKADEQEGQCCSCEGKPCWKLDTEVCPIGSLSVEYLDIFGKSVLFGPTDTSYVELIHKGGTLTEFPSGLCKWTEQMVTLDVRHNSLTDVNIVRCLVHLDTLRLDYNLIQYIDNSTFTKMTSLRVLTMSHNLLLRLDPNVLVVESGNIPIIDFSDNHNMDLLDISNVFRPGPFCTLNFTNSYVEHLTNELEFQMDEVIHGPGDILLEYTHVGSFINFTSIGVDDMKDLWKYIDGQIKIDASSVSCDCAMFPAIGTLGQDIGKYWANVDGQTFECNSPQSMKGKNLTEILKTGDFEDFTCDISEKPDCPHYLCHCIDMPSKDKVLVNCTRVGLKSMPERMPIGAWNNYKIDLILAENEITEISERNYYSRLVNLDLRQNYVTVFHKNAAGNISAVLNIENQLLDELPSILQRKNPNSITFGPHPIVCDCSNTWVGDWIRLKNGHGRLKCLVNGEVMPAENVSEVTLNCNKVTPLPSAAIITSAVGGITLFVLVTGCCFFFRYEIMILKRSILRRNFTEGVHKIDVFLSFYEDNEDVFRMVQRYIKPALVNARYTVFLPWEDIQYGTQRDDELATAVDRSLNYVIILCDGYTDDYRTISELETIWNSFAADNAKHIVLVNYDDLDSNAIKDERLRAMRRTRCLDFKTRESQLISRLKDKLGKPLSKCKSKDLEIVDNEGDISKNGADSEDITDDLIEDLQGNINPGKDETNMTRLSIFERLSMPKSSMCNCKYRKCYFHAEVTLFQRTTPNVRPISVVHV